ncbi:MAG TPA: SDR family oxidoreductase [Candidatus Binatia bacterium]|jgi:NAD(P)-dependent dehydrogenase (short-subunit alcohol dehydrogenase family)
MPNKSKSAAKRVRSPQTQRRQPGLESAMRPPPRAEDPERRGSGKLRDRVALVTGGDSGIGRAVGIAFAQEGADIAVVYLDEDDDAAETKRRIERHGARCLLLRGDVGDRAFCKQAVAETVATLGRLDVLVNNAGEQHPQDSIEDIAPEQLERTFRTNIFAMFYLAAAALPHLRKGSAVINTTSVTAYRGSPTLLDYAATKGAIVAFTRSLAANLAKREIRVNAVAPGPVWTPLIPSTFEPEKVETFGSDVPLQRAGQPEEIAPSYVFLASDDASYMTGQVLHPNGGEIING